jgi:hypothetical protein
MITFGVGEYKAIPRTLEIVLIVSYNTIKPVLTAVFLGGWGGEHEFGASGRISKFVNI